MLMSVVMTGSSIVEFDSFVDVVLVRVEREIVDHVVHFSGSKLNTTMTSKIITRHKHVTSLSNLVDQLLSNSSSYSERFIRIESQRRVIFAVCSVHLRVS
jgi:hypothetical protein